MKTNVIKLPSNYVSVILSFLMIFSINQGFAQDGLEDDPPALMIQYPNSGQTFKQTESINIRWT